MRACVRMCMRSFVCKCTSVDRLRPEVVIGCFNFFKDGVFEPGAQQLARLADQPQGSISLALQVVFLIGPGALSSGPHAVLASALLAATPTPTPSCKSPRSEVMQPLFCLKVIQLILRCHGKTAFSRWVVTGSSLLGRVAAVLYASLFSPTPIVPLRSGVQ